MRHFANWARLPAVLATFAAVLSTTTAGAQNDVPTPPAARHLLATFSWGTGNIGDIAIAPGLLNLLREFEPKLPVVVMTSQSAGSQSYARIAEYLPRYSEHCRVVPYPFAIGSDTKAGEPGSAWRAFHDRWGTSTLRAFENGTLSARVAARVADDILNRLPREMLDELQAKNPEAARALTDAGFVLLTSGTTLNFGRMGVRHFYSFSLKYSMPLSLGTPVLMPQFAENGRKVWMLEELDLRDWIFDIDEPADAPRLLEAALKIHQDPAQAQARIRRQLPRVRQLGLEMVTEIMMAWRK